MEIITSETKNSEQIKHNELERIELAKKLGNEHQEKVFKGKTLWQIEQALDKKYINFFGLQALAAYLKKNYQVDFGWHQRIFDKNSKIVDFCHNFENYEQRIPMYALSKMVEAKEIGAKNFYIIDPNLTVIKIDPFLICNIEGGIWWGNKLWLVAAWEDKGA